MTTFLSFDHTVNKIVSYEYINLKVKNNTFNHPPPPTNEN
jgi:hypothetical protein